MEIIKKDILEHLSDMGLFIDDQTGGFFDPVFSDTSVCVAEGLYEMISQSGDLVLFRDVSYFIKALEKTESQFKAKLFD